MSRFIFPPRPKSKIHPRQLPRFEKRGGWLAQRKFNGSRCLVLVENEKVQLFNRAGKEIPFRHYRNIRKEICALNLPEGQHCLDGELLDPRVKNTLVLFDVLQIQKYLIGVRQDKRLQLLTEICDHPTKICAQKCALEVSTHLWLAESWDRDFSQHFRELIDSPLIEGLMLRNSESKMDRAGSAPYEVDWQLRCRKAHKNYIC